MASGVLYNRGDEDDESDAWDDTMLIKAYDEAVSAMKAKLVAQHPECAVTNGPTSKKKKKNKQKSKKKKNSKHMVNGLSWKVGDHCQAVFSEDGQIYSAQILKIDEEEQTCIVFYVDYGNQEEQDLTDLLPALSEPPSSIDKTDTGSEIESVSEAPRDKTSNHRRSHQGTRSSKSSVPPWNWNNFAFPMPPPPPPPAQSATRIPPQSFPGFPHPPTFPTSGFGGPAHTPMFPGIPPPPPIFNNQNLDENESLYSMLISWYMSGYHTGYYQGLKNGKSSYLNGPHR